MKSAYVFALLLLSVNISPAENPPGANASAVPLSPDREGKMSLDGPDWKLQSAAVIDKRGEELSQPAYPTKGWPAAKVPGTVLANYIRDGLAPDPNFGDQMKSIPDETFQNDFWYRREFSVPALSANEHVFLNVDGINWKADIYLNGSSVGHIDGAFQRGQFEITDKLASGKTNALAFLIHKCANPGPRSFKDFARFHNGGVLGKDSPSFLASIGWNWMLSVPGRNIGIWDHVYLQKTGPVTLQAPFVHTTVSKDRRTAEVTVEATARNLDAAPHEAMLTGTFGGVSFAQKVSLAPGESKRLVFDKASFPQLVLQNPPLWWPNGYGGQPLQQLALSLQPFAGSAAYLDTRFGIRELSFDTSDGTLRLFCNGQRIQLNGGNWGMDETMLRYEAADYDTAVHLHQQMGMTMIRNWVGQVGKEEFLDACDKYGLLVWNDFWLANPADGPNPDDHAMFMANVDDRILRIRNHPSLALYCGRNEGNPPKDIDQGMAASTTSLDGTRYYIPNSKAGLATGGGPYEPHSPAWYFEKRGKTLHSELGIVCVPTADSMRLMMPEKDLWPIAGMWYLHDFYQPRCRTYTSRIDKSYGPSSSLDEFCEKAQMHNWENAKALTECWRSNGGSGGLIWMSHPAWPSLICQLYDYYLNPTAAYFGARKGNEPLHILWDAFTNQVKVGNNTGSDFRNLRAEAWVYNLDGTERSHQQAEVNSGAGGIATDCFTVNLPENLTPVYLLKLRLTNGGNTVSENLYWQGTAADDYLALNQMEKTTLSGSCKLAEHDGRSFIDIDLQNPTSHVALMVCAKVVRASKPGERVLPIFYDDNYVTLLPHESRRIRAEFDAALLKGDQPRVVVDGWNVPAMNLSR